MNHRSSRSVPPRRRVRRAVLLSLAVLGLASALFAARRPLMMSAPTCMGGRWHGCYDTFNGVVLMMLVAVPASASVVWALACRRRAVNTRAIDLTEALLLLSRGDRGNFTHEEVDLSLLAEEAAETLLPLAEQRRTTLDVTGGTARTSGSAELLLRMVTNLVQNAVVHNIPSGGAVTVHTEAEGGTSVLRVENTGPPVPPERVPTPSGGPPFSPGRCGAPPRAGERRDRPGRRGAGCGPGAPR
ncbi:ATP-binding protein [Streptomyces collinus]|uniref:ATP-binding protein n=1 Tax=Streptomyces collinus TaxID=42684 RepID=UPI0036B4AAA1